MRAALGALAWMIGWPVICLLPFLLSGCVYEGSTLVLGETPGWLAPACLVLLATLFWAAVDIASYHGAPRRADVAIPLLIMLVLAVIVTGCAFSAGSVQFAFGQSDAGVCSGRSVLSFDDRSVSLTCDGELRAAKGGAVSANAVGAIGAVRDLAVTGAARAVGVPVAP